MKTKFDSEENDLLVDAIFRDENWQATSEAGKIGALKTFHARQRNRRLTRWAGGVAALATLVASAGYWLGRPEVAPRQITIVRTEVLKAPGEDRHLTDEELVAAFPAGSCFIAEVDGEKKLVFFDPEVEHTYVAQYAARSK